MRFSPLAVRLLAALVASSPLVPRSLAAADPEPVTPTQKVVLFDGKDVADLSRFYTWLGPLGKNHDPNRVFTVVDQIDGARAIRASGDRPRIDRSWQPPPGPRDADVEGGLPGRTRLQSYLESVTGNRWAGP